MILCTIAAGVILWTGLCFTLHAHVFRIQVGLASWLVHPGDLTSRSRAQDSHYEWSDKTEDNFNNWAKNCTGREHEPECAPEERQQQWCARGGLPASDPVLPWVSQWRREAVKFKEQQSLPKIGGYDAGLAICCGTYSP